MRFVLSKTIRRNRARVADDRGTGAAGVVGHGRDMVDSILDAEETARWPPRTRGCVTRVAGARKAGLTRFTESRCSSPRLCLLRVPAAAAHGSPPLIDPPRLPAAGRWTATVTISEPGRYAITATSGSGTALQLVDRLAGPGEIAGAAGERDGRLDLLLDRGTYRLVTLGAERAAGEVRLEMRPFLEAERAAAPAARRGQTR